MANSTTMMASYTSADAFSSPDSGSSKSSRLSRQHRAWIALYALYSGQWTLADALRLNEVTESDLVEFEASWMRLRSRHTSNLTIVA